MDHKTSFNGPWLYIQLFRESLLVKSACDNPYGYCDYFENGTRHKSIASRAIFLNFPEMFKSGDRESTHNTFRDYHVHFLPTICPEIAV